LRFGIQNTDFLSKKWNLGFGQKYSLFLQFFDRCLAKSRRMSKRLTVLSSLLPLLTIGITFKENLFFDQFSHFL